MLLKCILFFLWINIQKHGQLRTSNVHKANLRKDSGLLVTTSFIPISTSNTSEWFTFDEYTLVNMFIIFLQRGRDKIISSPFADDTTVWCRHAADTLQRIWHIYYFH